MQSQRVVYYPGSEAKRAAFQQRFPAALQLGKSPTDDKADAIGRRPVPWLFAEGLSPEEADTENENWCGVFQVRGSWMRSIFCYGYCLMVLI